MQINGNTAAWGQMDFAPEAENRQPGGNAVQQDKRKTCASAEESGRAKKEQKDSYEQSDVEMLRYLELMKKERSGADRQRQVQSDELKALRIAHNIMRGKKVPPKDESFLLTKNFKLYMAAKNIAGMKECTGTAKSELGSDGGSASAGSGTSVGASSGGLVSAGGAFDTVALGDGFADAMTTAGEMAADGAEEIEDSPASDVAEMTAAEELMEEEASENEDSRSARDRMPAANGKTAAEIFAESVRGTDYSTLLEGLKSSDNMVRSSGISRSASTSRNRKKRRRLQYNFKEISARITSAKTSGSARQVLTQARQRSASLRKQLKSGEYDEEAIQIALMHAEAMERVAKKKMRHLEEEESASKTGGVCAGDTEEEDRIEQQMQDEQLRYEMRTEAYPGGFASGATAAAATNPELPPEDVSIEELMAEAVQIVDITGGMEELMEDFEDLMEDTLEAAANLNELAEDMLSGGGKTIDPADLEEKKRKHRTEEQRAIAEADSKYLRAFFNKLQREQQAVASGAAKIAAAMNSGGGILSLASAPASTSAAAATDTAAGNTSAEPAEIAVTAEPVSMEKPAESAAAPVADLSVSVDTAVSVVSIDVSV